MTRPLEWRAPATIRFKAIVRALPPRPVRLALLVHERINARLGILALDGAGHELGREGVGLGEVHLHVLVEHRLARSDLLRRFCGEVLGRCPRYLLALCRSAVPPPPSPSHP